MLSFKNKISYSDRHVVITLLLLLLSRFSRVRRIMVLTLFPSWLLILNIFLCANLQSVYLLQWNICLCLLPILWLDCWVFFVVVDIWAFIIYLFFVRYVVCQYLLSVCSLFFHLLNRVFCRAKFLKWSSVYQIFLSWILLLVSSLRALYLDLYSEDVSYVSFFLKVF